MLGIKPILKIDNAGKLTAVDKIRGRRHALHVVLDKMSGTVGAVQGDFFMVGHGDCESDARYVAEQASRRFGIRDYMIGHIGPVIGTHSGPGTIALFLMGEQR